MSGVSEGGVRGGGCEVSIQQTTDYPSSCKLHHMMPCVTTALQGVPTLKPNDTGHSADSEDTWQTLQHTSVLTSSHIAPYQHCLLMHHCTTATHTQSAELALTHA